MAETPAKERQKPGRKVETASQRLTRLEAEMQQARQAVAEEQQKRLATIGEAVLAEAENDPETMNTLRRILRLRVTSKAGRAVVGDLLAVPSGKAHGKDA